MESEVITLQDLFEFKVESISPDRTITGQLYATGLRPIFTHKFDKHGIQLPHELFKPGAPMTLSARLAAR
jgi:pilus assembly protein CpaF